MEKYQDLIINLIKNHRRYQGCESILDDIVQEVMERARTVVDAIEDESIVTKYLTKIVSTAMITVPKEHNICPEVKKRAHTVQQETFVPQQEISVPKQETFTLEQEDTGLEQTEEIESPQIDENELMESLENSYEPETEENTAIYDSIKNSLTFGEDEQSENDEIEEEISKEENQEDGFVTDFTPVISNEPEISEESEEFNSESQFGEVAEETEYLEASDKTADNQELDDNYDNSSNNEVDKDLVDKMINGAEPQVELDNIADKIEGLSAIYGEKEDAAEEIDSVFEEDNDLVVDSDNESVDLISQADEASENMLDLENTEETSEEEAQMQEILEEVAEDEAPLEELSEETIEGETPLEELTEETIEDEVLSENDTEEPIEYNTPLEEIAETAPDISETEESDIAEQFNPPNLSCFNFSTEYNKPSGLTELEDAIKSCANKNSDIPVIEIWKSKYCENKSVTEIATNLSMSNEDVLDVITELVDLAKE